MKPRIRGLLLLVVVSLVSVLQSGCYLQGISGWVSPETASSGAIVNVKAGSVLGECRGDDDPIPGGFVNCGYFIGTEEAGDIFEVTSTVELIDDFGLFGVLIDPVILQVPEDAHDASGTFTYTLNSFSQPLVITETESFNVQPGEVVTAEPGQKFLILELEDGWPYINIEFDFELTFHYPEVEPIDVKAMFAGRVDVAGKPYHIPLLPCTTDFANVPEFTIPVADTPQDLTPDLLDYLLDNPDPGCDGEVYDFRFDAAWGDDDCNLMINAADALMNLRNLAEFGVASDPGCPTIGDGVGVQPAGFGQQLWGDTNCDGEHNTGDVLQILRYTANLSVIPQPTCPAIGDPIVFQPE